MRPINAGRWGARAVPLLAVGLAGSLACPIQRPAVPRAYFDFRAELERAVEDTAAPLLRARPGAAPTLESNLALLSSYTLVDSVVASLSREPGLEPFARAVEAAVRGVLGSDDVGGAVRSAYEKPDGQRLAVDGIVIGLGRAIRASRREAGELR